MNGSYHNHLTIAPESPPLIDALAHYPSRELSRGETLYAVSDEADTIYRVEEGLLKLSIDLLTGKERIMSIAGPGDYIGAITPQKTHQDSAEALSPTVKVTIIPQDNYDSQMQPELQLAAGEQINRLRDALEDTELPVPSRIARTMVRLGERFGQRADNGDIRLTLPLTHENLASMVGAARETTSAILSEMREYGVLEGTRGRYQFNEQTLEDFAIEASF